MYSYIYASIYVLQVRSQKDSMERALRSEVESLKEKLQSEGYGLSSTATDTAQSNLMIETVRMESVSNTLTCDSRVLTYDTLCCALLPWKFDVYPILSYLEHSNPPSSILIELSPMLPTLRYLILTLPSAATPWGGFIKSSSGDRQSKVSYTIILPLLNSSCLSTPSLHILSSRILIHSAVMSIIASFHLISSPPRLLIPECCPSFTSFYWPSFCSLLSCLWKADCIAVREQACPVHRRIFISRTPTRWGNKGACSSQSAPCSEVMGQAAFSWRVLPGCLPVCLSACLFTNLSVCLPAYSYFESNKI